MLTELSKGVVGRQYLLTLTPLTPIHVWSGRSVLVGVDAIPRRDELCVVDLDKVPPGTILEIVKGSTNIKEVVKVLANAGLCSKRLTLCGINSLPQNSEVRLLSRGMVPASTIKGYLRTAMMYYILKSKHGRELASIFRSCIDLTKRPKQVSSGLEGKVFRLPRGTRAGGFIDLMQKVIVSEPSIGECRTALTEFQVHELRGASTTLKARVLVEALMKGTLMYRVVMLENVNKELVATRRESVDALIDKYEEVYEVNMLNALKDFGCTVLKDELRRVKRINGLRTYKSLLQEWVSKYCEGGGNCAIGRVGLMTGHQAKTVLHLLREVDIELYNQVLGYMSRQVRGVWDSRTVKLAATPEGLVGVGWCEICMEGA